MLAAQLEWLNDWTETELIIPPFRILCRPLPQMPETFQERKQKQSRMMSGSKLVSFFSR